MGEKDEQTKTDIFRRVRNDVVARVYGDGFRRPQKPGAEQGTNNAHAAQPFGNTSSPSQVVKTIQTDAKCEVTKEFELVNEDVSHTPRIVVID